MTRRIRCRFSVLLLAAAQWPATAAVAADTIYALACDDGSISLSNVPTERGYKPLVRDGAEPPRQAAARPPPAVKSAAKARFDALVDRTASSVGVDSALLHAVISVESRYDPTARSSKGAAGLMQLMPATARRYGVVDAFDPVQNVQGGAKYLRDLLDQFDSDLGLALAAYNAGETAVVRYGRRMPPYPETENYVPRVLSYYHKYQADEQARQ